MFGRPFVVKTEEDKNTNMTKRQRKRIRQRNNKIEKE
jgi:hypothetical protein